MLASSLPVSRPMPIASGRLAVRLIRGSFTISLQRAAKIKFV
jgi:hypothetical protein